MNKAKVTVYVKPKEEEKPIYLACYMIEDFTKWLDLQYTKYNAKLVSEIYNFTEIEIGDRIYRCEVEE